MTDLPDDDRFTMPGRIPDASDPSWRMPKAERIADWRARGLMHPAGRGWAPVPGSRPVPLHHPADGPSFDTLRTGTPPVGEESRVRPAPGKEQWPQGWLPGDPPIQYVDADLLAQEMEGDPAAAARQFDTAARVRFLDCLATLGEVRAAAARVGVSHETCYRARRRWPDFARLWDGALLLARTRAEGELASRTYSGVKVPVFLRGEHVATYRRHDPRYLAMLLARLDRKAEACPEAAETAGRFDELLALHAGHETPAGFGEAAGLWGEDRDDAGDAAARFPTRREYAAWHASQAIEGVDPEDEARVWAAARAEGEALYDAWREGGMARVDAIVLPEAGDEGEGEVASPLQPAGEPAPGLNRGAGGGPVEPDATADTPTPSPSRRREGDSPDDLPIEYKSYPLPAGEEGASWPPISTPLERVTGVNTPADRPCGIAAPDLLSDKFPASAGPVTTMKPTATLRTCALSLAALTFAGAAQAADAPRFSWGKAGVSYDQYGTDAYECAMVGLSSDIDDTKPVEALRTATRQMDALEGRRQSIGNAADPVGAGSAYANDVESIRSAARPERQVEEIKKIVFPVIQRCMMERGYTRFALTEEQRAAIARVDGSQERRVLLHTLASDAAVLEGQKQPLAE